MEKIKRIQRLAKICNLKLQAKSKSLDRVTFLVGKLVANAEFWHIGEFMDVMVERNVQRWSASPAPNQNSVNSF